MTTTVTTPTAIKPTAADCRRGDLECKLARYAAAGPEAISDRLGELNNEWTSGRLTKATAGLLVLAGFALTAAFNPWWLLLPVFGGAVLAQYAIFRRSWLAGMFQEMGYRSGAQIEEERIALRALRGDFQHLPTVHDVESRDDITRLEGEGGIVYEPEHAKIDPKDAAHAVLEAARA